MGNCLPSEAQVVDVPQVLGSRISKILLDKAATAEELSAGDTILTYIYNEVINANSATVVGVSGVHFTVSGGLDLYEGTLGVRHEEAGTITNEDLKTALGNLGTTEAIDWNAASYFTGTLDANVTITHTNETSGQKVTIALIYDGTAQRSITWSDVDKWITGGGVAPTTPSAAGQELVVTLLFLGTTCYAAASTNY